MQTDIPEFFYGYDGLDMRKPPSDWKPYELINSPDWYALKYYFSCRRPEDLYVDSAHTMHRYYPAPDGQTTCVSFKMYPTNEFPEGRWLKLKARQVPPTEWDGKQVLTKAQLNEMRTRPREKHWDEWEDQPTISL